MLLLLLGLPALAHFPHDVYEWVAASPSGQLAAEFTRTSVHSVCFSEDQYNWASRYLGPAGTSYLDGTWLSEERLVAGSTNSGLWATEDMGRSWQQVPEIAATATVNHLAISPALAKDGVAFAASVHDDGSPVLRNTVWRTSDGGDTWQEVLALSGSSAWVGVAVSPDFAVDGRVCAFPAQGDIQCSRDGGDSWQEIAPPEDTGTPSHIALGPGEALWLGAGSELLLTVDRGRSWTLLDTPAASNLNLLTVLEDGTVYLADNHTIWSSPDDAATWIETVDGLDPRSDETGGPPDGEHFRGIERGPDGRLYVATWEGIYLWEPTDQRWVQRHAMQVTSVRTITSAPRSAGGAWVILGTEGGGTILTDTSRGLAWPMGALRPGADSVNLHTRELEVPPDFEEDGTVVYANAWGVLLSRNWGFDWALKASGVSPILVSMGGDLDGDGVLIAGGSRLDRQFAWLPRGADDLELGRANPPCEDGGANMGQINPWPGATDTLVAACAPQGTIYESTNRGEIWTGIGQAPEASVLTLVRLPDGSATWLATSIGLLTLPAGASETETLAFEGELVQWLAMSPDFEEDGTAFVVLARGAWFRTQDHGQSWQQLDAPTDQLPWQIDVPADFAESGVVVVGTTDGAWASLDRGETWQWIWMLDRLEESSSTSQVRFEPDEAWPVELVEGASGGRVRRATSEGVEIRADFEGIKAQLYMATSPEGGSVELSLDGGPAETIDLAGDSNPHALVWEASDLEPGWHELYIVAGEGTVAFDVLHVWEQLPAEDGPTPWELSGGDTGMADGGSEDGGGQDSGTPQSDGGAEPGDGGSGDGGSPGGPDGGEDTDSGCGCAQGSRAGGLLWLGLALCLAARRRKTTKVCPRDPSPRG